MEGEEGKGKGKGGGREMEGKGREREGEREGQTQILPSRHMSPGLIAVAVEKGPTVMPLHYVTP